MDEWQSASTSNVVLIIVIILVVVGIIAIIVAVSASSSSSSNTSTTSSNSEVNQQNQEEDEDDEDDDDEDDVFEVTSPKSSAPGQFKLSSQHPPQQPNPTMQCMGKCNTIAPVERVDPPAVNVPSSIPNINFDNKDSEVIDSSEHPSKDSSLHLSEQPSKDLSEDRSEYHLVNTDMSSGEIVDIEELARMEDLASVEDFNASYTPDSSIRSEDSEPSSPDSPRSSAPDIESEKRSEPDSSARSFDLSSNDSGELNKNNGAWESFTFSSSSKTSDLSEGSPAKETRVVLPQIGNLSLPRPVIPQPPKISPYVPQPTRKTNSETSGISLDQSLSNPASFSSDFSSMTERSERPSIPIPQPSRRQTSKVVAPPLIPASDLHIKYNQNNRGNQGKPPRMGPF
jgi:hypothetical protein